MNEEPTPAATPEPEHRPSFVEAISANSKVAQNADGGIDVLSTVGGVRGILETVVPGFVFVIVYAVTSQLSWALISSIALGVVFMVWRLATKSTLLQSLSGLIGILICALVARTSGNARDYYVPGFFISAGYLLALMVSIFVKWPLIGLLFGFIRNESLSWRQQPDRLRRYSIATWLLCAVFLLRLLVQLPMYFSDQVVSLGVARALMGVPLYALALWFAWLISRPVQGVEAAAEEDPAA
ncbi:DUF3159 domain-containing protein [Glutamicibacter sp.]|uniref:DUF3159 domain-containing protein n=1 Tax=Glutamicibacter sp. TaxID=1931995 RepID=UPI0028BF5117|nr:DUF3159 domain-containing protein [Glutamicibacter sp.]